MGVPSLVSATLTGAKGNILTVTVSEASGLALAFPLSVVAGGRTYTPLWFGNAGNATVFTFTLPGFAFRGETVTFDFTGNAFESVSTGDPNVESLGEAVTNTSGLFKSRVRRQDCRVSRAQR